MEVNLIPNCSESTFRIDITNLKPEQIEKIKEIWDAGVKAFMKEEKTTYEPEGSELYEKTIFGTEVLEANGDFPFNCSEEIDSIIADAEAKLKITLKTEKE